jgi:hypothetical protein
MILAILLFVNVCLATGSSFVSTMSASQANSGQEAELVINEILLRNNALEDIAFRDEDGTKQAWIELYNRGNVVLHLDGYYLSDNSEWLSKWALPAMALGPGECLLVWGSGKNRHEPTGPLHTSFNITASAGVYLTHVDNSKERLVDGISPLNVPIDHSWGRSPDGSDGWYFYDRPSPGCANRNRRERPFAIQERHVSLTVEVGYQLTLLPAETEVVWCSNNPFVSVNDDGFLMVCADVFGQLARATISAESLDGKYKDECDVTIVSWTANLSQLKVVSTSIFNLPGDEFILGMERGGLFYTYGKHLNVTYDGFQTHQQLSSLPQYPTRGSKVLVTPFGYFYCCGRSTHVSHDLMNWQHSFTTTVNEDVRSLRHGIDYWWEEESNTGYLYGGEYSADPNHRHSVYRGSFVPDREAKWDQILAFASLAEWERDWSIRDAVRHIHVVSVDPYTGHVWVGTGDANVHSRIIYSDDRGENFRLVGMGEQVWRTLSIWFTEHYVYWNMDTEKNQRIWRIPRLKYEEEGFWPTMTPELTSGETKIGVHYYVTANKTREFFPTSVGHIYEETTPRPLDQENRVRAIDDPQYHYKEKVADLSNGSLWYHLWVVNDLGEPIVILGGSAEGAQRDRRGRVFGIKEGLDGSVDVQELISVPSNQPSAYLPYVQLEPEIQDADGYIYLRGRNTSHLMYKTKLIWRDHPGSMP